MAAQQVSKDGTKKVAYRLEDGQMIESVLMPYSDGRRTACISSQAGCAMGCVFCATGQVTDPRYAWRRMGVILQHDWFILPVHDLLPFRSLVALCWGL